MIYLLRRKCGWCLSRRYAKYLYEVVPGILFACKNGFECEQERQRKMHYLRQALGLLRSAKVRKTRDQTLFS